MLHHRTTDFETPAMKEHRSSSGNNDDKGMQIGLNFYKLLLMDLFIIELWKTLDELINSLPY